MPLGAGDRPELRVLRWDQRGWAAQGCWGQAMVKDCRIRLPCVWLQLLAGTVAEGDLWPGRKMTGGGEGEVSVCVVSELSQETCGLRER